MALWEKPEEELAKPYILVRRKLLTTMVGSKKSVACYFCNGPHKAMDCPKRERVLMHEGDQTTGGNKVWLTLSSPCSQSKVEEQCDQYRWRRLILVRPSRPSLILLLLTPLFQEMCPPG